VSSVKSEEFVTDSISHLILRDRCYDIVLNVHDPTESIIDERRDSFYEEIERVFDKFHKKTL
jgi:hypothetical protein